MKRINCKEKPIQILGIPGFEKEQKFERFGQELLSQLEVMQDSLRIRCPGARICFRTDSPRFTVKVKLGSMHVDVGLAIFSWQSACVFTGPRDHMTYLGLVNPGNYQCLEAEKSFEKSALMEEVTIYLPRGEHVEDIDIYIEENARIEAPVPYRITKPVIYYGSSITEGSHSSLPVTAYTDILSCRLGFDYYNLGFSGSARGELAFAEYINTLPCSVFVYDYDHNAPDVEHLKRTHEPFFKAIRQKQPNLPVIMMSKPVACVSEDDRLRCAVIRQTYENALKAGDQNVYFIDGSSYFGEAQRHLCSTDTVHPNDLGFYRMADTIEPVLKKALGI